MGTPAWTVTVNESDPSENPPMTIELRPGRRGEYVPSGTKKTISVFIPMARMPVRTFLPIRHHRFMMTTPEPRNYTISLRADVARKQRR